MTDLTFFFWWVIAASTGFAFGDLARELVRRSLTKPKTKDPHENAYDVPPLERGAEEE